MKWSISKCSASLTVESGLNDHLLAQYKLIKVSPIEQPEKASIYYSMAAFVEDNTTFDQINMNYFFYLFCFTILSQLLLLCIKMIERPLLTFLFAHFTRKTRPNKINRRKNAERSLIYSKWEHQPKFADKECSNFPNLTKIKRTSTHTADHKRLSKTDLELLNSKHSIELHHRKKR